MRFRCKECKNDLHIDKITCLRVHHVGLGFLLFFVSAAASAGIIWILWLIFHSRYIYTATAHCDECKKYYEFSFKKSFYKFYPSQTNINVK